jgi:hypothetical protein
MDRGARVEGAPRPAGTPWPEAATSLARSSINWTVVRRAGSGDGPLKTTVCHAVAALGHGVPAG